MIKRALTSPSTTCGVETFSRLPTRSSGELQLSCRLLTGLYACSRLMALAQVFVVALSVRYSLIYCYKIPHVVGSQVPNASQVLQVDYLLYS